MTSDQTTHTDPRTLLDDAPMGRAQILAVAITVALNALDGFDVLAISFAAPGIVAEWNINRAELGVVLAMELIGMSLGSIMLGGLTDRFGRRPANLGCLMLMTVGMLLSATAGSVIELGMWRVLTGIGIGGMLASINATAAEYANRKSRNLCVSLMAIGYPLGAIVGGTIAAQLLRLFDWRAVFFFGAGMTALMIPLTFILLKETVPYLCQRRPAHALEKVNRELRRLGHPTVDRLPEVSTDHDETSPLAIFNPAMLRTTLMLTLAYFMHIATFYFLLKWIPEIVVGMGFTPAHAAGVLIWANIGGASGGILLGLLGRYLPIRQITMAALCLSVVTVIWFGQGANSLAHMSLVAGLTGFCTNAGVVGLYALFAQRFPTAHRASGTGFAIGVGRGGAALSPIVVGVLFTMGLGLQGVAVIMALGAAIAVAALLILGKSPAEMNKQATRPDGRT
ncbi:MFS transporter [Larsenimonas rhizosphaerae]|uniref:MFS transporter n=1 Tax=Larsenimonas rhizosphaerae TaxID=2944682 RepID=A0AA41ZIL4_9GAMM|nr:MFS transporter [Larsenimonas rhizosphaerae]MCM2131220.1 MFS transporter [Larsenimonas rhizosphaerae]MCX2525421.1 MFS transporter [Larsenimonas rhizosphaerae]